MSAHFVDPLSATGAQLLRSGLAVAVITGLVATGAAWGVVSPGAGLSLGVGAIIGLVAMAIGLAIVIGARRLATSATLVMALGAYALAIAAVIAGLVWIRHQGFLSMVWTGSGIAVGAYGYLAGVIVAHRRARIPVFDQETSTSEEAGQPDDGIES